MNIARWGLDLVRTFAMDFLMSLLFSNSYIMVVELKVRQGRVNNSKLCHGEKEFIEKLQFAYASKFIFCFMLHL